MCAISNKMVECEYFALENATECYECNNKLIIIYPIDGYLNKKGTLSLRSKPGKNSVNF